MATKSKKLNPYSPKLKAFAVVLIIISGVVFFWSQMFLFENQANWGASPLNNAEYTDSREFNERFSKYIYDTININLLYKSEENIKAGNALDYDILLRNFFAKSDLDAITQQMLLEILPEYGYDEPLYNVYNSFENIGSRYIDAEIFAAEEAVLERYVNDFVEYREYAISAQLNDFKLAKARVSQYVNIGYYLKSNTDDISFSNKSLKSITTQPKNTIMDGTYINGTYITTIGYDYNNFAGGAEEILKEYDYTMYAAAMSPFIEGDVLYDSWLKFEAQKDDIPVAMGLVIGAAALMVLLIIYLFSVCGRNERGGEIHLTAIDSIYTDIHTVLLIIAAVISVHVGLNLAMDVLHNMLSSTSSWMILGQGTLCAVFIADICIGLSYALSIARHIKNKSLFSHSLIGTIMRKTTVALTKRSFSTWFVLAVIIYWLINFVLFLFLCEVYSGYPDKVSIFFIILIVLFNLAVLCFCLKMINSISRIMKAAKEISEGNVNYELDPKSVSPAFSNFAENVAGLQKGIKSAINEAVKGEKMRTDLITNVSHDL
ncbi:MAG: hypothetical protein IJC39_04390, partial [Firmicutes bacterium]|nr:hypothetical protein [Bacillota bacterium]